MAEKKEVKKEKVVPIAKKEEPKIITPGEVACNQMLEGMKEVIGPDVMLVGFAFTADGQLKMGSSHDLTTENKIRLKNELELQVMKAMAYAVQAEMAKNQYNAAQGNRAQRRAKEKVDKKIEIVKK